MPTWADFEKRAQGYADGIDKIIASTVVQICRNIVKRTPVGNPDLWESDAPPGYVGGRARANWFPSIGSPSNEETESVADQSMGRVQAIIGQVPGNVFYLTNNLPYIRRLEYDAWSSQAPRGMVRVSLREAEQALRNAARQHS